MQWLADRLSPEAFRALPAEYSQFDPERAKAVKTQATERDRHARGGRRADPKLEAWIREHQLRFQRIISRRDGIAIGPQWTIKRAEADPFEIQALILIAEDRHGHELRLALTRGDAEVPFYASSERFRLFVLSSERFDSSRELAVKVFAKQIGLTLAKTSNGNGDVVRRERRVHMKVLPAPWSNNPTEEAAGRGRSAWGPRKR